MAKCSFCKTPIEPGTGMMFVRKDGSVLNFCAKKCEKNMLELGRAARFMKWTKAFEKGEVKK